ncbi:CDP-alcohol phosphatidyltransferase family protein [Candidatus Parcubacteria bacterium]|nr:CDP-alcohol phosphatidyltransferase family protein [Candidatus Parcubacteria bacterium]
MIGIKELRKICQKSEYAPSWRTQSLEGRINRIFSIYLTWIFIHTPITPNKITAIGTIFYLSGAFLFIFNKYNLHIAGLLLMFVSFILDASDGEVARYRKYKGAGIGGAYVEPVSHDIMYSFFFLPIGVGVSLAIGNLLPIIAAFVATVSKLLFRLAELRYDFLERVLTEARGEIFKYSKGGETPKSLSYFVYRNFFTGTGMFLFLVVAVFIEHIDWFLYFYAVSFFFFWCYKMFRQFKRIKKLK